MILNICNWLELFFSKKNKVRFNKQKLEIRNIRQLFVQHIFYLRSLFLLISVSEHFLSAIENAVRSINTSPLSSTILSVGEYMIWLLICTALCNSTNFVTTNCKLYVSRKNIHKVNYIAILSVIFSVVYGSVLWFCSKYLNVNFFRC